MNELFFGKFFMNDDDDDDDGTQVEVVHFQTGWRTGDGGVVKLLHHHTFSSPSPRKRNAFHHFCHSTEWRQKKSTRVPAGWLECIRHWLCSFGLINVIFFFSSIFAALCGDRKLRIWNAHFKIKQPIEVILGWPTLFNKKKSRALQADKFCAIISNLLTWISGAFRRFFLLQLLLRG